MQEKINLTDPAYKYYDLLRIINQSEISERKAGIRMRKKYVGIIMFLFLGMIILSIGCEGLQSETRLERYENRFIQMDYPAQWTYEEVNNENLIAVRFEEEGEEFVFELSITGIENWLEEEEKLELMEEMAIQQSQEEDFEILENEEIEIDGQPGIKIVDQRENRGIRQTVATVFNYRQLAMNFAGTVEAYEEYEDLVEETIDSIEIISEP